MSNLTNSATIRELTYTMGPEKIPFYCVGEELASEAEAEGWAYSPLQRAWVRPVDGRYVKHVAADGWIYWAIPVTREVCNGIDGSGNPVYTVFTTNAAGTCIHMEKFDNLAEAEAWIRWA